MLSYFKISGLSNPDLNEEINLKINEKSLDKVDVLDNNLLPILAIYQSSLSISQNTLKAIYFTKQLLFNQDKNLFKTVYDVFQEKTNNPITFTIAFIDAQQNECKMELVFNKNGILSELLTLKNEQYQKPVELLKRYEDGYFEMDLEKVTPNLSLVPLNYVEKENSAFYTVEMFVRIKSVIRQLYKEFDKLAPLSYLEIHENNWKENIEKRIEFFLEHKRVILKISQIIGLDLFDYGFEGDSFNGYGNMWIKQNNSNKVILLEQENINYIRQLLFLVKVLELVVNQSIILLLDIDQIPNNKEINFFLNFFDDKKWNITGSQLLIASKNLELLKENNFENTDELN